MGTKPWQEHKECSSEPKPLKGDTSFDGFRAEGSFYCTGVKSSDTKIERKTKHSIKNKRIWEDSWNNQGKQVIYPWSESDRILHHRGLLIEAAFTLPLWLIKQGQKPATSQKPWITTDGTSFAFKFRGIVDWVSYVKRTEVLNSFISFNIYWTSSDAKITKPLSCPFHSFVYFFYEAKILCSIAFRNQLLWDGNSQWRLVTKGC